jgi:hypothetical protein
VLIPTQILSTLFISRGWTYFHFGLFDLERQTSLPGARQPLMLPVFGSEQSSHRRREISHPREIFYIAAEKWLVVFFV